MDSDQYVLKGYMVSNSDMSLFYNYKSKKFNPIDDGDPTFYLSRKEAENTVRGLKNWHGKSMDCKVVDVEATLLVDDKDSLDS